MFADRDRAGANGTRVARAAVVAGTNAVPIALPASLPPGRCWPHVVISGPFGSVTWYATSPVDLSRQDVVGQATCARWAAS